MKINDYAYQKGQEFNTILDKNKDKSSIANAFDQHFLYTRYYLQDWLDFFLQGFFKNTNSSIFRQYNLDFFDEIFRLETPIHKKHIDAIEYVVENKNFPYFLKHNIVDDDNVLFLYNYKEYLMKLHLCSLIYHFILLNNKGFSTVYELMSLINKHSITQKIFYINDNSIFKIPLNKSPCFLFWIQQNLIGIDVSFSNFNEKKFITLHSLLMEKIMAEHPKEIQNNFINFHKEKSFKIVSNSKNSLVAKHNKKSDQQNFYNHHINHIISDFSLAFSPLFSVKDQMIIRKIANEQNVVYGFYIEESFFEKQLFYTHKKDQNFIDFTTFYQERKKWLKDIFKSIFYHDEYHLMKYSLDSISPSILPSIFNNIVDKIDFLINNSLIDNAQSILYEFGFQSSNEISYFINEITQKNEDFGFQLNHLKNDPKKAILESFLKHLQKTR